MLRKIDTPCTEREFSVRILWCYGEKSTVMTRRLLPSNGIYKEGVTENFGGLGGKSCLVILDDLITDIYSKQVCDLFTRGRDKKKYQRGLGCAKSVSSATLL